MMQVNQRQLNSSSDIAHFSDTLQTEFGYKSV